MGKDELLKEAREYVTIGHKHYFVFKDGQYEWESCARCELRRRIDAALAQPADAEIVERCAKDLYNARVPQRTIWGMENTDFGDGFREGVLALRDAIRALSPAPAATIYHCDICKDTGMYPVGTSGTEADGNAIEFESCDCGGDPKRSSTPSNYVLVPREPTIFERRFLEGKTGCNWLEGWKQMADRAMMLAATTKEIEL